MTNTQRFSNAFFASHEKSDAVLLTSHSSRFYVTGFQSSDGLVFVTREKTYLIVDFRYYEMAEKSVKFPVETLLAEGRFSDVLKTLIKKHSIKNIWIEDAHLSVADFEIYKKRFPDISFSNLGNALDEVRAVKNDEEISFIKQAQKITDSAFSHILNFISPKKTEKEVALELEFFMRKNGADGIAFDTICVSGEKSSLPHGTPSDIPISQNAFLTMDFGAKFNGYCADMTRTVVLGRANDEMREVYSVVLEAQKRALATIKGNVLGSEVDSAARDYIYSKGFEGCFGHSTGHGLGIDVHEAPSFSPKYNKAIPEGAILSVEPGIYLHAKWGVRIEDIVLVTRDGCMNLTSSDKDLIEI